MTRWLVLALAIAASGCVTAPGPTIPWPSPPAQPDAPTPPVDPPSVPADVAAVLDKIAVGATVDAASSAVGVAPVIVGGAARWFVGTRMVYAVIGPDGKIARKGVTVLEEVR